MADAFRQTAAPAYQEYPGDMLARIEFVSMSYEARGIYLTLKYYAWRSPGGLTSNPKKLAGILNLPFKRLTRVLPDVLPMCEERDGFLLFPDLEAQRARHQAFRAKSILGGVRSGESRRRLAETRIQSTNSPEPGKKGASASVESNREPNTNIFDLRSSNFDLQATEQERRLSDVAPSGGSTTSAKPDAKTIPTETLVHGLPTVPTIDPEGIRQLYNRICASDHLLRPLPVCSKLTTRLINHAKARLRDCADHSWWEALFTAVANSTMTDGSWDFRPGLEWLIKNDENCRKVLDGNYSRRAKDNISSALKLNTPPYDPERTAARAAECDHRAAAVAERRQEARAAIAAASPALRDGLEAVAAKELEAFDISPERYSELVLESMISFVVDRAKGRNVQAALDELSAQQANGQHRGCGDLTSTKSIGE